MYIVAEKDSESPSDPDCLIDIYGDFARLYGMRGEFLWLIRPDDHIGLFQIPLNEDATQLQLTSCASQRGECKYLRCYAPGIERRRVSSELSILFGDSGLMQKQSARVIGQCEQNPYRCFRERK